MAERVTELERQLAALGEENAALRALVQALEAELERLRREQSKHSGNSGKRRRRTP